MLDKAISWTGSCAATITATLATITHNDVRLWAIAVASIAISIIGSLRNKRKARADAEAAEARALAEQYESQRERIELCSTCIACKHRPFTCVVNEEKRPQECPLRK